MSGTARFVFAAGVFLAGCAGRKIPQQQPPGERFWHDCQEVVTAKPDGFQHFLCVDRYEKQWEVLIKRAGKGSSENSGHSSRKAVETQPGAIEQPHTD